MVICSISIPHKKVQLSFVLLVLLCNHAMAQNIVEKKSNLTWNAFLDTYYSFDFSKPTNHLKPQFLFNHNRHNEVNVNLALITLSYSDSTKRATIGLMGGTYPQYNLASEPEVLRHIYEAIIAHR